MKPLLPISRRRKRRRHTDSHLLPRGVRLTVYTCLLLTVIIALPSQKALRLLYPLRYENTLRYEAQRRNVDLRLVAAVARVESHFDADAVSSQGAIGVMQVMPATGEWVAQKLRISNWREEHLYDPEVNIRVGVWYLAYLIDKFDGQIAPALAAYNGGFTNVQRWIAKGQWDGSKTASHRIPFPETRRYVERVLRAYEWYVRVYPDHGPTQTADRQGVGLARALASAASEGFGRLLSK